MAHMNVRHISACIIGNVIEWYEFTLYAYLSPVIAKQFFPNNDQVTGLLITFMVFAAGFLIRPLGAIVLGHLGDTKGRAKTLRLSVLLLSIPSILTGLLPTYNEVGLLAPVLLLICRLLQGFCIGGEFAGAMIYLSESAPDNKRAFYSAMTNNGSNLGVLLAIFSCFALSHQLTSHAFNHYGWRMLFIFSGVVGLLGLALRGNIKESHLYREFSYSYQHRKPLLIALKTHRKAMFSIVLLLVVSACGDYTIMNYISTYMHVFLKMPMDLAYRYQLYIILLSLVLLPLFASLADKFGRRVVFYFACIGYFSMSFFCFYWFKTSHSFITLIPLVLFYSAEQAVLPVMMVELFPIEARYSGLSLAYNITLALVGGSSPMIVTYLVQYFHSPLMIAYYVMACSLVSFIAAVFILPKSFGQSHSLITAKANA